MKIATGSRIAGLAVASMGESGVLIDDTGDPLAPVLTWYDHRTVPWIEWWRQRIPEDDLYRITGLALDHIYSGLAKSNGCAKTIPAAFSRAKAAEPCRLDHVSPDRSTFHQL